MHCRSLALVCLIHLYCSSLAQNVGIGTANPQRKLHVAGSIRFDTLAGSNGIVTKNGTGDLSFLNYSGNNADVLKGDGTFGSINGITPSSGVITSKIYNNSNLINAGYTLIGEIPGVTTYSLVSNTFAATAVLPTYTRGITSNVSAPTYSSGGNIPSAAWDGSLMYVFADKTYTYDPDTDLWAIVNATGFLSSKVVWTGTEFLVMDANSFSLLKRYNPTTNIWTTTSITNKPSSRNDFSAIWDGSRLIVWGGESGGTPLNTGGIYVPSTDTWTAMNTTGAPVARQKHNAVWSTSVSRMIVWGGASSEFSGEMNTGGLFNPATNTWTGATSTTNAPTARFNHSGVWTGTEMIIFGGESSVSGGGVNTGGRYNAATNTWTSTNTAGAPALKQHGATWSGTQMYVGGAKSSTDNTYFAIYDPAIDTWTINAGLPETGKLNGHCFYKSNVVVFWGGSNGNPLNTGFRYLVTSFATSYVELLAATLYLYQKN